MLSITKQTYWHKFFSWLLFVFLLFGGNVTASGAENGILSGQVLDVSQKPVAGVEIFVYTSSNTRKPADYISAPSNTNGEFQVTLPPGTYWTIARLRQSRERFGPLQSGDKHSGAPLEIDIAPGENVQEDFVVADLEETSRLAVKFDTSFLKVEGILLTKQGEPVKNGYAYANSSPARKKIPDYISAWTGEDGRYTLFLPEGTFYFAAGHQFPPDAESVDFQKVSIDSNTKNNNIVTEK